MIERLVVAIGGNATHPENIRGTTGEQEEIAARAEIQRRVACLVTRVEVGAHVIPG